MRNENYKIWETKINDFDQSQPIEKQIEFLLKFGMMAPSGHNSQPWKCKIRSNGLNIFINHLHSLSESDPKQRQLFISFGCFLENLLIAADYYGFSVQVKSNFSEEKQKSEILNITFNRIANIKNDSNHLVFQIPQRHSNRYEYKIQAPSDSLIKKLADLSSDDIKIFFINDQKQKYDIAEILEHAQIESMEDTTFRKELSNYIKSSFTKEKFGMPGFALAIPAPVSIIASRLIKKVNLSKLSAKKDLKVFQKFTPVIGIICSVKDNKHSWLESGKIFEKLWLYATSEKLVCSVWAAAVQAEKFRLKLQYKLNTKFMPTVIFRLGYPKVNPKPSPRFSLSNILE